jgi:hypothetical protein
MYTGGTFRFVIDGSGYTELLSLGTSEPTEWQKVTMDVPNGSTKVSWIAMPFLSEFTAFLDEVTFTPSHRFRFNSARPLSEQGLQFILESETGMVFQIERSEDLIQWQPFVAITNQTGVVNIEDVDAPRRNRSFYRAVGK